MSSWKTTILVFFLLFILQSQSLIHSNVLFNDEKRDFFLVEKFAFKSGGTMKLNITDFIIRGVGANSSASFAILLYITSTGSVERASITKSSLQCGQPRQSDNPKYFLIPIDLDANKGWTRSFMIESRGLYDVGFYNIFFVSCANGKPVSFRLQMELINPGNNHLSAEDIPLPNMYALLSILYVALITVWIFGFIRPHIHLSLIHI
eukprot:TRINITY_DN2026_c0_g4_i3.p1 TRINITY_DN2026_c0_g4~~TRINITY_DN2026_c0_g4_i3.p1  ORF type:complete len:215 (-),score=24.42 TRINITY_DN2026_c0_g4_i3:26-643(-)